MKQCAGHLLVAAMLLCALLISGVRADDAKLESFVGAVDEYANATLAEKQFSGAVFTVVSSSGHAYMRTYGKETSLDSRFAIGSITKLFTAIAIMQSVVLGELELDAPVNHYLKSFQITTVDNTPVTVRHLMTHTGGFDANVYGVEPVNFEASRQSSEVLARVFRPVIKPGEVAQYDNYGVGLLGVLLSEVTGTSYADVLQERILEPLGMLSTIVGTPQGAENLFPCYDYLTREGWQACERHETLAQSVEASGAIFSTAPDMGAFLTMLLDSGTYEGHELLPRAAFNQLIDMQEVRIHPDLNGLGLVFYEYGVSGSGAYGHTGGIRGFRSNLVVSPRDGLAAFASIGGASGVDPLTPFGQLFGGPEGEALPTNGKYKFLNKTSDIIGLIEPSTQKREISTYPAPLPLDEITGQYSTEHLLAEPTIRWVERLIIWLSGSGTTVSKVDDGAIGVSGLGVFTLGVDGLYRNSEGDPIAFTRRGGRVVMTSSGGSDELYKTGFMSSWQVALVPLISFVFLMGFGLAAYKAPYRLLLVSGFTVGAMLFIEMEFIALANHGLVPFGLTYVWRVAALAALCTVLFGSYRLVRQPANSNTGSPTTHRAIMATMGLTFAVSAALVAGPLAWLFSL